MRVEFGKVTSVDAGGNSGYVKLPGNINSTPMPFTGKAGRGDFCPVVWIRGDRQNPVGIIPANRAKHLKRKITLANDWVSYYANSWNRSAVTTMTQAIDMATVANITPDRAYPAKHKAYDWTCTYPVPIPTEYELSGMRVALGDDGKYYGYSYDRYSIYRIDIEAQEIAWTHRIDFAKLPGTGAKLTNNAPNTAITVAGGKIWVLIDLYRYNHHYVYEDYSWISAEFGGSYLYAVTPDGDYDCVSEAIWTEHVGKDIYTTGLNPGRQWEGWTIAKEGEDNRQYTKHNCGLSTQLVSVGGGYPTLDNPDWVPGDPIQAGWYEEGVGEGNTYAEWYAEWVTGLEYEIIEHLLPIDPFEEPVLDKDGQYCTTSTYGHLIAIGNTVYVMRSGTKNTDTPPDVTDGDTTDYAAWEAEYTADMGFFLHSINLTELTTAMIEVAITGEQVSALPDPEMCYLQAQQKIVIACPSYLSGSTWVMGDVARYTLDLATQEKIITSGSRHITAMASWSNGAQDRLVTSWQDEAGVCGLTVYDHAGDSLYEIFSYNHPKILALLSEELNVEPDEAWSTGNICTFTAGNSFACVYAWYFRKGTQYYGLICQYSENANTAYSWQVGGTITSHSDFAATRVATDGSTSVYYLSGSRGIKRYAISGGARTALYGANLAAWSEELILGKNFVSVNKSDTIKLLT